jgi:hypothetical protein
MISFDSRWLSLMPNTVTPEELERVLSKGSSAAACAELFANVDEEDRRKLAALSIAWYRAAYAAWMDRPHKSSVVLPKNIGPGYLIDGVVVAVLATATWAEIRKLPEWSSFETRIDEQLRFDVMSSRKPHWIDDWAEAQVAATPENWAVVRKLNRAGIGNLSDSDVCISGMMASIDRFYVRDSTSIYERLVADPELLEHLIWRLFEVQRPNSLNFSARDEFRNSGVWADDGQKRDGWLEAFVRLSNEGQLSRDRLLDASLQAIEREFPDAMSRWFPKLHEALQPTLDDRQKFLPRYWSFLNSSNSSTVNFALELIQRLETNALLQDDDIVDHLPRVLLDKSKTRVRQAMKMLDRLAKRRPDLAPQVAFAATTALMHTATDIQQDAWKLIERLGSPTSGELCAALASSIDYVAASLRERIQTWLGDNSVTAASTTVSTGSPKDDLEELIATAQNLPEALSRIARIPELLAAIPTGDPNVPAVDLHSWTFPRLRSSVQVIGTLDELIDACAAAVEDVESADDIERILDGISRLCDERPDDFEQRTAPLRKRTLARLKASGGATFQGDNVVVDLLATIWAWLTGEVSEQTIVQHNVQNLQASTAGGEAWIAFPPSDPCWLRDAFSQRTRQIATSAATRQARPLLSSPTHIGGWIDPVILVQRTQLLRNQLSQTSEFDRNLSLLRLAPDHRAAAQDLWRQLAPQKDEFISALGHAIGIDGIDAGPTSSLWYAAARARSPWSDDPAVERRHPNGGADAGRAASYDLTFHHAGDHPGKIVLTLQPHRHALPLRAKTPYLPTGRLRDDFELPPVEPASPDFVWLLHDGLPNFWLCESGAITVAWAKSVWPANAQPLLARGLFHLIHNIDWTQKLWANRVYLQGLTDPDAPLPPIALLILIVGLAAKDDGESGIACDGLIAAIEDCRLQGAEFGRIFASVLSTGLFKISRIAARLKQIAPVSELHADCVRRGLAIVFQGVTSSDTRDLAQLLELYLELTVGEGQSVPPATLEWLRQFKGTGKSAKAVKSLLAVPSSSDAPKQRERHRLDLKSRIDRVRRWSKAFGET